MILLSFLLAASPQVPFSRFVLDVPGQILETQRIDADHDGKVEFWLASKDEDRRFLSVFEQTANLGYPATPSRKFPVSRAVVAWAVGDFVAEDGAAQAEIIFTTRDAVYLQPLTGRPKKILQQELLLDLPSSDELPVWEEVADFDGDGLDEIVLPTREGFLILSGTGEIKAEIPWTPSEGRVPVASRILFGGKARATLSSSKLSELFVPDESAGILEKPPLLFTSISLPRPSIDDLNGDGRLDLSFLVENQIRVHFQAEDGTFKRNPNVKLGLPPARGADNEELRWGHWGGGPAADLLLLRSDSGFGLSKDWVVKVWMDASQDKKLGPATFTRKAEGGWVSPYLRDVDQDGLVDLVISAWEFSLGLTLRDPSVDHTLFLFRGEEKGGFATRAALSHERDYNVSDLDSFALVPTLVADLTGDGKLDLLENTGKGELEIRSVVQNGQFRVGDAVSRIPIDALAAVILIEDLNGDQIGDLLVRHFSHWEIYLSRG